MNEPKNNGRPPQSDALRKVVTVRLKTAGLPEGKAGAIVAVVPGRAQALLTAGAAEAVAD